MTTEITPAECSEGASGTEGADDVPYIQVPDLAEHPSDQVRAELPPRLLPPPFPGPGNGPESRADEDRQAPAVEDGRQDDSQNGGEMGPAEAPASSEISGPDSAGKDREEAIGEVTQLGSSGRAPQAAPQVQPPTSATRAPATGRPALTLGTLVRVGAIGIVMAGAFGAIIVLTKPGGFSSHGVHSGQPPAHAAVAGQHEAASREERPGREAQPGPDVAAPGNDESVPGSPETPTEDDDQGIPTPSPGDSSDPSASAETTFDAFALGGEPPDDPGEETPEDRPACGCEDEPAHGRPGTCECPGAEPPIPGARDAGDAPGAVRETAPVEDHITLRGVPEGASVLLDGERSAGTDLRVTRDGRAHTLVVEAEGFRRWSQTFRTSGDRQVVVSLRPVVAPRADVGQPARSTPRPPRPTKRPPAEDGVTHTGAVLVRDPGY